MMSPEAEQRYAEIVAENKARFDNPEFQRAARLFFSRQDWLSRQESPEQRRQRIKENWCIAAFTLAAIAGGIWVMLHIDPWLEQRARDAHPGMHWVPPIEGHWEKDPMF